MTIDKPSHLAFTIHYPGKVNVLKSEVQIAEAFDFKDPTVKPNWRPFKCIWDTGASCSIITMKIINDLNLQPTGKVNCHTVGGPKIKNSYLVAIGLPNKVAFPAVKVVEGEVGGADALIGMDIISCGDFAVTNKDDVTVMSYQVPSNHEIDFVDEINRKKLTPEHHNMSDDEKRKARNKQKKDRKKGK